MAILPKQHASGESVPGAGTQRAGHARRKRPLRMGFAASCAAAAALVLAACGGTGSGGTGTPSGLPTNGNTATFAEQPGFIPNYLFPFTDAKHFGTWNIDDVQYLLYRPLYWFGVGQNPTVNWPLSIGQQPTFSADSKTVTVTLKPYKWSNGETVNGNDVLFWMNMYKAEKLNYGGYVPGYFPDNVASVSSPNPTTVVFHMTTAYNHNWWLENEGPQITPMPAAWDRTASGPAHCDTNINDCKAVYNYLIAQNGNIAGYASSPVWSVVDGPWKLKTFGTDGNVSMVRNPTYSGPNFVPKGQTPIAGLKEVPFASFAAEYNSLKSGTSTVQNGYIPPEDITAPTTNPSVAGPNPLSPNFNLVPWGGYTTYYFPINMNNPTVGPIFKQLYFRQALQDSIDTASIIKNVFHGYGWPTTNGVPTRPSSSLLAPGLQNEQFPFNISKAKQLLTANGWNVSTNPGTCVKPGTGAGECGAGIKAGEKLSFNLKYSSGTAFLTSEFQAVQSDAGQAGIQLTLSQQAGEEITANDISCTPSQPQCKWQMGDWGTGWVYAPDYYPSGEDLFGTGSVANYGSYSDPHNDQLIKDTLAPNATNQTMWTWERYIAQQNPVVWMPDYPLQLEEIAANLKGVTPLNVFDNINPEDWYYTK